MASGSASPAAPRSASCSASESGWGDRAPIPGPARRSGGSSASPGGGGRLTGGAARRVGVPGPTDLESWLSYRKSAYQGCLLGSSWVFVCQLPSELQAETMRFAIKFEPSAVQFSWYELECQLREILGEARVQQGLEELWRDVRNQAVLTDLGSECEPAGCDLCYNEGSSGWLPWKLKKFGSSLLPAGCMVCVCDARWDSPHPGDLPGQAHRSGEDLSGRTIVGLYSCGRVSADQEYLKNHHIVVEVGVVCLADVSLSPGWTSALPRRWALSGVGNNYRYLAPEMPKLLGMWPLILVGLVKGSLSSNSNTGLSRWELQCICKTSEGMGNFGRRLKDWW
ncbi:hypothetical protein PAPYR_13088 [Paratrimastix pyriformis]|uniref:Uncharacterized protein n=1 Tax=Paratrimastix pyriformis TaxID=342808 RepID=A0ABQ8U7E2_9EUKA|nr:hypothetical protein PAPYR_13088 [Paratrimastix pyriformis]